MTVDHRIVISLDEIVSVTLECVNCHTRLSSDPDHPQTLYQCPCKQQWHFAGGPEDHPFKHFLDALRDARALLPDFEKGAAPPAGFKVLLEIRDPSAASGARPSASAQPSPSAR